MVLPPCHFLRHIGHHLFGAAHDTLIIGIGFVKLKLGKFRVVLKAHPFVAEVAPDLIDAVKAADDQPLEIKLKGDAQVEVLVQLVVMGDKGLAAAPP